MEFSRVPDIFNEINDLIESVCLDDFQFKHLPVPDPRVD